MMRSIRFCLLAVSLFSAACGGDDTPEQTLPDLASTKDLAGNTNDLSGAGDMPVTCPQPSDTCVMNPTTHEGIINACVTGDVVKIDITPFYPAQGYDNCVLPPR